MEMCVKSLGWPPASHIVLKKHVHISELNIFTYKLKDRHSICVENILSTLHNFVRQATMITLSFAFRILKEFADS